jgi:hypothetical protein
MFVFEINTAAVNNNLGNLRRGRIIEVDERLAIDDLAKHGKVFSHECDIPGRALGC